MNARTLSLLAAAAIALLPLKALAAGALAVGVTGNPSDGLAFGTAWNYKTEDAARDAAVQRCREYQGAPKAVKFCKVAGTFVDGCLAIAFDPKDDSPGMGWTVSDTRDNAERRAMDECRRTAPTDRRQFCKIVTVKCDGDPAN
jgi:hypothetical protein